MSRSKVTMAENSAAILLPQELLNEMGIAVGDEIDVVLDGKTLVLRSLDEAERAKKLKQITDSVFERRASAYQKLAEGVE